MLDQSELDLAKQYLIVFKTLDRLSKELQRDGLTLAKGRSYVENVLSREHEGKLMVEDRKVFTPKRICANGTLTHDASFESAVVKLQTGVSHGSQFTAAEQRKINHLKKSNDNPTGVGDSGSNYDDNNDDDPFDFVTKKRKVDEYHNYHNVDFVWASNAKVERVFSSAKIILRDHCARLNPITLEAILFLRENKSFWGIADVSLVRRNLKEKKMAAKKNPPTDNTVVNATVNLTDTDDEED